MLFRVVQTVTYGNIDSCGAGDAGRRQDDGTVYANILPSPSPAAAEPQYDDSDAAQRVVYSRLYSDQCR